MTHPHPNNSDGDPWLDPWLALLRAHGSEHEVLELGCGSGRDTAVLHAAGLQVTAIDADALAIESARRQLPGVRFEVQDLREPFPELATPAGAVLASLCLHYFSWPETEAIVARVHQALRPGGLLLCRVNADDDWHFGANGHEAIEPGLFLVHGQLKRFFSETAMHRLFGSGWTCLSLRKQRIDRYAQPKSVWEFVGLRRDEEAALSPAGQDRRKPC